RGRGALDAEDRRAAFFAPPPIGQLAAVGQRENRVLEDDSVLGLVKRFHLPTRWGGRRHRRRVGRFPSPLAGEGDPAAKRPGRMRRLIYFMTHAAFNMS